MENSPQNIGGYTDIFTVYTDSGTAWLGGVYVGVGKLAENGV